MVHDNKIRPGIQKIERLRDVLRFAATPKHQPESCPTRNVIGFWCVRPLFYVVAPLVGREGGYSKLPENPLDDSRMLAFGRLPPCGRSANPLGFLQRSFTIVSSSSPSFWRGLSHS